MFQSARRSGTSKNPVEAVRELVEHAERYLRLQLELRTLGLRRKAISVGIGVGLALTAVLLAPLVLAFLLAAAAAALATVISVWLAILIVACILLVIVGGLAGGAFLLTVAAFKRDAGSDG